MINTGKNKLSVGNEDSREYFGLENMIFHSYLAAEVPVLSSLPAVEKPVSRSRFLSFLSRAAVLLVIFSFLFLLQDFMFHYVTKPAVTPVKPAVQTPTDNYSIPSSKDWKTETPVNTPEETTTETTPSYSGFDHKMMPPLPLAQDEEIETAVTEEPVAESTSNATHAQPDVDIKPAADTHSDSVFYIIASTFKSQANADRLYFQLFKTGKPAYLLSGRDGKHRVGIAKFYNRERAERAASTLRERGQIKDAWVYGE